MEPYQHSITFAKGNHNYINYTFAASNGTKLSVFLRTQLKIRCKHKKYYPTDKTCLHHIDVCMYVYAYIDVDNTKQHIILQT